MIGCRHQKQNEFRIELIFVENFILNEFMTQTTFQDAFMDVLIFIKKTLSVKIIPSKQAQYWLSILKSKSTKVV